MPTKRVQQGITRFDIENRGTFGYMVRISRMEQKFNRFFSDKEYGGKRKALDEARKHYEELVAQLPPPKSSKNVKSSRNKSGRVGVHLAVNPSEHWEGIEYSSYVASWKTQQGQRQKISFSIQKYGKKDALELATIARENETTDRERILELYASGSGKKKTKKKAAKKKVAKKTKAASKKKPKATKKASKKKVTKKRATKAKATKKSAKKKSKKKR